MPSRSSDPGIPTLTHRAEPSLHDAARHDVDVDADAEAPWLTELADEAGPAYDDDPFPVLRDVADEADAAESPPPLAAAARMHAPAHEPPTAAPPPAAPLPDATVLAARLQAEVEQAMRKALADAIEQIQARMDTELPAIVSRVLNDVRRG